MGNLSFIQFPQFEYMQSVGIHDQRCQRPERQSRYTFCWVSILFLYCDQRRDIRWNIARDRGKSQGRSPRNFSMLMLHFIVYPNSSHNTDILNCNSSIKLPGRSILEELIPRIAPTTGQYGQILPSRLSNTGELKLNIIMFSNWECFVIGVDVNTLEDFLLGVLGVINIVRPLPTEVYLEVVVDIAVNLLGAIGSELCREGGDLQGTCNFGGPEGSRCRGDDTYDFVCSKLNIHLLFETFLFQYEGYIIGTFLTV